MKKDQSTKPQSCFVLFSRAVDKNARKLFKQISPITQFYVLTYSDKGVHSIKTVDGITHIVFNRSSLKELFENSQPKFHTNNWSIMPGNLDLCQLLFVHHFDQYETYWFCEDDVRYTGNFATFLNACEANHDDLLVTNIRKMKSDWWHQKSYASPVNSPMVDTLVFLPFFRITKHAAHILIDAFANGWGGHHEISWPSVLSYFDCSITDFNDVVDNCYSSTPDSIGMGPGSFIYEPAKLTAGLKRNTLYHPVKDRREFFKRRKKSMIGALRKIWRSWS